MPLAELPLQVAQNSKAGPKKPPPKPAPATKSKGKKRQDGKENPKVVAGTLSCARNGICVILSSVVILWGACRVTPIQQIP